MSTPSTEVTLKATYSWKLLFSIDNTKNPTGEYERKVIIEGSRKINSKTHRDALASSVKSKDFTTSVGANVTASLGPVSATTETSATWADSSTLTDSLQEITDTETESTKSFKVEQTFKAGPGSKLNLYQLVITAPGLYYETTTISTNDQLTVEVAHFDVSYTLVPKYRFVKNFTVEFAPDRVSQPAGALTEFSGQNNDINSGFKGSYSFIVPHYTFNAAEALTNLSVVIQNIENKNFVDMAQGSGGDYRYLFQSRQEGYHNYITEPCLLRSGDPVSNFGAYNGRTTDINQNRGGSYLYVVWKFVTL